MTTHTETRAYCDRHIDSIHKPECPTCDSLTREWRALATWTVCQNHPMRFIPCEKCGDDD